MADTELVRKSLISCLNHALPSHTPEGHPSVLGPDTRGELWLQATLPYNLRLAGSIGPLAIVYPQTSEGIAASIQCAKAHKVPAVPRSGGHSYGAYSSGGAVNIDDEASSSTHPRLYPPPITPDAPIPAEPSLVIDMRAFRGVNYNFQAQTVQIGAGTLLGEMSSVLEKVGRMIPCGSCPTVGVGGQAVSGGFGLMSRSHGLLLDNMLSAEVVLADGRSVMTSRHRHPDLYWAIRGGGSSFGIAHSFVFRTHPAPSTVIYYELTLLPRALSSTKEAVERAANMYMAFQEYGEIAPSAMGLAWHMTPEEDGNGGYGTKVEVLGQVVGDEEELEVVMTEFEEVMERWGVGELQKEKRVFTYLESMHNTGGNWTLLPERGPLNLQEHIDFYAKSLLTKKALARESIHDHMKYLLSLAPRTNPSTHTDWFVLSPFLGGEHSAIAKQSNSAFAHRDLKVVWEIYAKKLDKNDDLDLVELVGRMSQDLTSVEAIYPAYVDPELTASEYPRLIWGDNYPRLQSLKRQYDPSNVFRYPQSVRADQSFPWASVWLVMVASAALFWIVHHIRGRRAGAKTRLD